MRVYEMDEATISDALDVMRYGADSVSRIRDYARGRVVYDIGAREVYSYGRHFPLCRYVPARVRGRGRPDLFVINGDRWSGPNSRTNGHQAFTRSRIERIYSSAESVVIPFTALDGAGIDIDSIRLVHARPDANWQETRTARELAEVPLGHRYERYTVELEEKSLELVPERERETWRAPVGAELETGHSGARYLPRLPDADGLYRWSESRTRPIERGADGLYRWDVHLHRLGDSLFTAVRAITYDRPPDPFESSRDTARVRVELCAVDPSTRAARWSDYCESAPETAPAREHESGPSGACIHCGAELIARETWRRRALYLSSFDTNELAPLYFLAEVPRHPYAPDSVESALDALAPRAVHAATARGRHIARQGDVFFVDTDLTRDELERRGATFARLTQWTRDAAPKRGEVTYVERPPIKVRRARYRAELNYARRLYLESSARELVRAIWDERAEIGRSNARAESDRQWFELRRRQAAELASAPLQLDGIGAPTLAACANCGAGIGEPCTAAPDPRGYCRHRHELAELHENERHTLQRETARKSHSYARPETGTSTRRARRAARERIALELESANRKLRAAILAGPARGDRARYARYEVNELGERVQLSALETRRREHCELIAAARERVETVRERIRRDALGARGERDSYRRVSPRALEGWRRARDAAQLRFRPLTVWNSPIHAERRERVRRAVSIYGTAHSATETARVGGAVYVRGIVRHVPDLERGRVGGADHRPVTLTPDRWYLAVRNTVPRQATRRRRRPRSSSRAARG